MTTVNAQVDNDIYVCSRNQYGDEVLVRIEAPNGNVYLSRREHCGKRLFERLLPRHGYVNETQSHRLYTRLVQVAGIAESKLAAHAAATGRDLFTARGVASARKLGYTATFLRDRAAVYQRNALAYTSEEAREQALGLAYHYEQVAAALEAEEES